MAGARGEPRRLVSTYYDTPDRALARHGLSLRVRGQDGQFVQTVKAQGGNGDAPFSRGEWEDAVAGPEPDPAAPVSGGLIDPRIAPRLIPLFRTEINRRIFDLSAIPGSRIEAAVDRGRILAPGTGRNEPVGEVELELKEGPAARLYDVALDLLAAAPLRLEWCSKAERGYRLAAAGAEPVAATHASAVDLDPRMTADAALRRIGLSCLEQILRNEAAVLALSVEGVHQMRVAVRRLRAVLSAFGRLLPRNERRRASQEMRWLADALGAARNLEAFENMLPAAPADIAAGDGMRALREGVERQRREAYGEASRAVCSPRYTAMMLRLLLWFETCGWQTGNGAPDLRRPVGSLANSILDRRRRAAKRRRKGFARQSAAERHRLRIALKKLRYAGDALAVLYDPGEVRAYLKRVKRLQNDLGEANDLRIGHRIVTELACHYDGGAAIAEAGEAILREHEQRLKKREPKLRSRLDRLFDADPFWRR